MIPFRQKYLPISSPHLLSLCCVHLCEKSESGPIHWADRNSGLPNRKIHMWGWRKTDLEHNNVYLLCEFKNVKPTCDTARETRFHTMEYRKWPLQLEMEKDTIFSWDRRHIKWGSGSRRETLSRHSTRKTI